MCVLEPNSRTGVFWRIWSKISGSLACLCIKDTTYVETNDVLRKPQTFHSCTHLICIGQWAHIRIDTWSHSLVVDPRETESREIHFNSSDHLFHITCIAAWSSVNSATHKAATAVASSYCNTNFHTD